MKQHSLLLIQQFVHPGSTVRRICEGVGSTRGSLILIHHYSDAIMGSMTSQITSPHHCFFNRLFRRRSMKTSKFRVTGLYARNSPVTGKFPAQMASNAEYVSIWWHHHGLAAWRHKALTWTNVDCGQVRPSDNHLRGISQEIPQPSSSKISLIITIRISQGPMKVVIISISNIWQNTKWRVMNKVQFYASPS